MEDLELLQAVATKNKDAMATLFDKYAPLVYSITLRVLHEPAAAEDLTQEILLQVWRQPGSFVAQKGSLAAWLALVARNRSIDVIRRRAQLTPLEEMVVPEPRNLPHLGEQADRVSRVRAAIKALPEEDLTPLQMAYFEGSTHTEISQRTRVPLATVKTRIRTALHVVRTALEA
jgi:RNA polymerase sigma-70 factor (ECF subfamily)